MHAKLMNMLDSRWKPFSKRGMHYPPMDVQDPEKTMVRTFQMPHDAAYEPGQLRVHSQYLLTYQRLSPRGPDELVLHLVMSHEIAGREEKDTFRKGKIIDLKKRNPVAVGFEAIRPILREITYLREPPSD